MQTHNEVTTLDGTTCENNQPPINKSPTDFAHLSYNSFLTAENTSLHPSHERIKKLVNPFEEENHLSDSGTLIPLHYQTPMNQRDQHFFSAFEEKNRNTHHTVTPEQDHLLPRTSRDEDCPDEGYIKIQACPITSVGTENFNITPIDTCSLLALVPLSISFMLLLKTNHFAKEFSIYHLAITFLSAGMFSVGILLFNHCLFVLYRKHISCEERQHILIVSLMTSLWVGYFLMKTLDIFSKSPEICDVAAPSLEKNICLNFTFTT